MGLLFPDFSISLYKFFCAFFIYTYSKIRVNLFTIQTCPLEIYFMFPNKGILKLSDLYQISETEPMLELKVVMLNINDGHNEILKENC